MRPTPRRASLTLAAAALAFALAFAAGAPTPARAQGGPGKPPPVLIDPAPARTPPATPANAASWRLKQTLRGHEGAVYSAAFLPGGARVVTSGDDGNLRLWNVTTGTLLRTVAGPGGTI